MKEYLLDHMTWQELGDVLSQIDAVFIPVGATEQHGPHLEIRFDAFSASELCYRAARTLNEQGRWSRPPSIMAFLGTIATCRGPSRSLMRPSGM